MTLVRTESAMSSSAHTPRPAMTRSKNMYTPARTSVTPSMRSAKVAVGVEPTLTTGHGSPASLSASAHCTTAARSRSAMARISSIEVQL